MNFQLILVLAMFLTGAIWLFDAVWLRPKRRATAGSEGETMPETGKRRESLWVEYSRAFFPVILVVLVLRSFVVEPFRIPSASMMPTLLIGDFILVNKFSYGLRLPVLHDKVVSVGEPQRGDVVVFRYPGDPSQDWIKRIIGVPGDRIEYRDKVVYVNGRALKQDDVGFYVGEHMTGARVHREHMQRLEHLILTVPSVQGNLGMLARPGGVVVPKGQYFVMGDNRDDSNDSRFWGFVPEKNLVGRAFLIWFNWESLSHMPKWSRIG
ncbi:MAG: signal peptidase I, partial [Gammaproteobacteria bacterium]